MLPFPQSMEDSKKERFVFRLVFKPETGTLWGYNEFQCEKDLFHEVELSEIMKKGKMETLESMQD